MKIDKELLLKHHFWALVGIFLLAWAIGFATVMFGSSSDEEQKKY